MRYDPAVSATTGYSNKTTAQAAGVRFTAAELGAHVGKQVKTISFQPAGGSGDSVDAAYVFIESGRTRVFTQEVENVQMGAMNTVNVVAQEFVIPEGKDLYIGYGLVNSSVTYPLLVQECDPENVGLVGQFEQKKVVSWSEMKLNDVTYTPILSATIGEPVLPELGFNHIANPGNGTYAAGDSFEFSLVRYEDDPPSSVEWTFDGEAVSGDSVTLSAGSHTVEAWLSYPDGSSEVIRLVIRAD